MTWKCAHLPQHHFLPLRYTKNRFLKISDFSPNFGQKPFFSPILKNQKNQKKWEKIFKIFQNFVIFRHILVRKHFDPTHFWSKKIFQKISFFEKLSRYSVFFRSETWIWKISTYIFICKIFNAIGSIFFSVERF